MPDFYLWAVKDDTGAWKCLIDGRPLATFYEDTANSPDIRRRAFNAAHGKPATLLRFKGGIEIETMTDPNAIKEPQLPLSV